MIVRFSGVGTSSARTAPARTTIGERAWTRETALERTLALKDVRCTRVLASMATIFQTLDINYWRFCGGKSVKNGGFSMRMMFSSKREFSMKPAIFMLI